MAKNFIQPGDVITVPAPAATAAGEPVIIADLKGVAANTAALGEPLDIETRGIWELPKVAANTFAIGAAVYWDAVAKLATSTASGNTKLGYAAAAAANGGPTVAVRLT